MQQQQVCRNVPLTRWGVGNEMIVVVQNEFGKFEGRTVAFDSMPGCLTTPLYHAGIKELDALGDEAKTPQDLLQISYRLRQALHIQLAAIPQDQTLWINTIQGIVSCWRVLEIQLLEPQGDNVRNLVVDWANEIHPQQLQLEQENDPFQLGLSLLLKGKGQDAGKEFQKLIPTMGPRMQRFFEVLTAVSMALPMHSNLEEDWQRWQSSLVRLEQCLPTEDQTLVQVVKLLRGDVSSLVRHFRETDGGTWPQLLAAILIFKAPTAKSNVLPALADRCMEPFKTKQFDATRVAFRGDAIAALERLHDLEAWSECHMALLFARGNNNNAEFSQSLLIKFACQVGLGPGRVETRPVNGDFASLALAVEYLRYCSAPQMYFDLVFNHCNLLSSELFAKKVYELADNVCALVTQTKRIAKIQVLKWMRIGALQNALKWADGDSALEQLLLDHILNNFHDIYPQQDHHSYSSTMGKMPSETKRTITKLLTVRHELALGNEQSIGVLLECVESSVVPVNKRLGLLHSVLVQNYKFASVNQCIQVTRIVNAQFHDNSPQANELLVLMTNRISELCKQQN